MIITCDQLPEYFEFASKVLDSNLEHGHLCKAVTLLNDDGSPAAVTVFTRFSPGNCEMSIATDGKKLWARRDFLYASFAYPFNILGKRRVMGVVNENNEAALRLDRQLGFKDEGRLRKWFGEEDGILLGMLREECRWLTRGRHV